MPGYLSETEDEFKSIYMSSSLSAANVPKTKSDFDFTIDSHIERVDENMLNVMYHGLKYRVDPFILRREKKDVLKDLPPKIIQDYYCDLTPIQEDVYKNFLSNSSSIIQSMLREKNTDSLTTTPSKTKGGVLQAIHSIRKIVLHPSLLDNQSHLIHSNDTLKNDRHHIFQSGKMESLFHLLLECGFCSDNNGAATHRYIISERNK